MGERITGHHRLIYPSAYLAAPDLHGRDINVIIDHLEFVELEMAGGKKDVKACVFMRSPKTNRPTGKSWPVGKTVLAQIAMATGETEVAKWSDKLITIYPTTCKGPKGATVECVRVRVRANKAAEEPNETIMAPPSRTPLVFDEDDDTDAEAIGLRDATAATAAPAIVASSSPSVITPPILPGPDRATITPIVPVENPPPCAKCGAAAGYRYGENADLCAECYEPPVDPVHVASPPAAATPPGSGGATSPEPAPVVDENARNAAGLAALVAFLDANGPCTAVAASKTMRDGLGMQKLHVARRSALLAIGVERGMITVTGEGDAALIARAVAPAPVTSSDSSPPAGKGDDVNPETW